MARLLVKASEFKNVCKAVNDRKLAELKKEIIEILKNQDEKEVKKAIDYFNSQELHYTHLEKSFNGKWVEKAGYGVGTVRIWKGKKYKKIAPGKWARVFEKEGRGTNIAIGKLIAKVQKIDNVEDLMAFVMANKQRFVDENGVDLPVLDKLRAAVDARNGSVGSKTSGLKLSDKELERLKEQNMTVENLRHKGYTDEEIKEFAKPKASKEEIRNQVINGYKNKSQDEIEKDLAYLRKQIKSDDSMTVSLVGSEKMPIKDAIEILKDIKKNKPAEKYEDNSRYVEISKDKMKSMSDDELKDYEAKLEKDLLATNRTDPDYVEKYNHWREVHGENNDRFHQRIEDEARAEKQAETDAKAQKENEIKERYNGYFDGKKGLDKARDLKTLEKKYNFDGKVMSSKEFVEQAMDNGVEIKEREVNKLDYPSRTRWNRMNGYEQDEYEKRIKAAGKKTIYSIDGYEFPKTVVDYAKFYKEKNGNVKKSVFDDFVMDMFIDEDEEIEDAIKTDESLFNDYSAEQPELFNSTELMVREAFNRCRVL